MGNVHGFIKRNGSCYESPVCCPDMGDAAFPPPVSPSQLTFTWHLLAALQNRSCGLSPWWGEALKQSDKCSLADCAFSSQPTTVH